MAPGFFAKLWKGIKKGFNVGKKVINTLAPVVKPLVEKIPGAGSAISKGIDIAQNVVNTGDQLLNGGGTGGRRRGNAFASPNFRGAGQPALDYYAPPPTQQSRRTGTEFLGPILQKMDYSRQLTGGDGFGSYGR